MIAAARRLVVPLASLLLVLSASSAHAGVAFVQSHSTGCSTGSSCADTLTSNTTQHNLVWVFIYRADVTTTVSSVDGSACGGATFTILDDPTGLTDTRVAHAYAKDIPGGACTVTVNFSGSATTPIVATHEASGADLTSPLDGHTANCQTSPGLSADAVTSGTITTTANGDYIVSGTADDGGQNNTAAAGTSPIAYTLREQAATYHGFATEDFIQSAAASIAATYTLTGGIGSVNQCTVIAAFKAAVGGGGGGFPPCIIGGGYYGPGCPG